MASVPEKLEALGKLYADRNRAYGNNYKLYGAIAAALFPNGITLKTEEEFNRFALFSHCLDKFTRYARSMPKRGLPDNLDDIAVYAQMLSETDEYAERWAPRIPHIRKRRSKRMGRGR